MEGRVHSGDCLDLIHRLDIGSVDLVVVDPPFNIGYEYDVYADNLSKEAYVEWAEKWVAGLGRVMKDGAAIWVAIGDELLGYMQVLLDQHFTWRNTIAWHFTFGNSLKSKFSRSHTFWLYYVKGKKPRTWNVDAVRVPSARQLVYKDRRANGKGKPPDDTWILRPSDVPEAFSPDSDTWAISRVCGTFGERSGWHPCQMPEALLARIIRSCSNEGDLVLDPMAGSASALIVAKKLGRRYVGFELSEDYASKGNERLETAKLGEAISGEIPYATKTA